MLMPKRVKFRKYQRGDRKGVSFKGSDISFGEYGLQAMGNGWLTNTQIEACRVCIMRSLKGTGKLWIRPFPDKSVTKKAAETRMGKGKGMPLFWVSVIKRGRMIFELGGVAEEVAKDSLRFAASKLSIRTRFVSRKKH